MVSYPKYLKKKLETNKVHIFVTAYFISIVTGKQLRVDLNTYLQKPYLLAKQNSAWLLCLSTKYNFLFKNFVRICWKYLNHNHTQLNMTNCFKEKKAVSKSKVYFVLVSIIALYGILNLGYPSSSIVIGQSTTTETAVANNVQIQSTDFVMIPVQQHLGDNKNDIFAPGYPFRGDVSDTFNFTIDSDPDGEAYLLLQMYGSYFEGHTITINGENVTSPEGSFGNSGAFSWSTLTVPLADNILKQDENTIQFSRNPNTEDNFLIDNVVVNWKHQYLLAQ